METLAVEIPEPSGPFGMKGAGEIGIDGPLPAVANAETEAMREKDLSIALNGGEDSFGHGKYYQVQ